MKKALAFLVLFAAGLLVLRWVQGPGTGTDVAPDEPEIPDFTEPIRDDVEGGLTLRSSGRASRYLEAEGRARAVDLEIRWNDSDRESADRHRLEGVLLEYLDPETRELVLKIEARTLRLTEIDDVEPKDQADGREELLPSFDRKLHLEDVVLTVLRDAPIVPLTFRMPDLVVDLEARTMTTDAPVEVEGDRLQADGRGLFADEVEGTLDIDEDGEARFLTEDGFEGSLGSKGELSIERDPASVEPLLEIGATGGASLLPGPRSRLDADDITLKALESEDPEEPLVLRSVEATRDVVYTLGENRFTGESLDADFGPDNRPTRVELEGEPTARVTLEDAGARIPDDRIEDLRFVTVEGAGPMIVLFDEGTDVTVGGPASIEASGTTLTAVDSVHAWASEDGEKARFTAKGEVELQRDDGVLATDEIGVDVGLDENGTTTLAARAEGRSVLTGSTPDGRRFVLRSDERIEYEQVGDAWTIPEALGVELTVLGEEGFHARADRVENFDPSTLSLTASGDIRFENADGSGRGQRLTVQGRELFVLTGTKDDLASFTGDEGSVEAQHVRRAGETLELRLDVHAEITPSEELEGLYDLRCDRMTVSRERIEDPDGTVTSSFVVDAVGAVHGTVEAGGDRLELNCSDLYGTLTEKRDAEGTLVEAISFVDARDLRRSHVGRAPDLGLRLSCDQLVAERTERGPERTVVAGGAVASGNVLFHGNSEDFPFNGTAVLFSIDHENVTTLAGTEDQRVFLAGRLPSNGRPFELEADWIRSSETELVARMPYIEVLSMEGGDQRIDIVAHAGELHSTRTWLELEKRVHVEGVTDNAIPWTLDADRVSFEGTAARSEEGGEVSSMSAEGNVELVLTDRDARVIGDVLETEALSGIMRLSGAPARVVSPFAVVEAEWIEIDVNLGFVVGTGKGRIVPEDPQAAGGAWSVEYLSSRTLVSPDLLILVLQEPSVEYPDQDILWFLPASDLTVDSSWAVIWINRHAWGELPRRLAEDEVELEDIERDLREAADESEDFLEQLARYGVNEIYLEGPVEASFEDGPTSRADAVYLDVIDGHGWLADASFTLEGSFFGRDDRKVRVRADWLRRSADQSLHADDATITPLRLRGSAHRDHDGRLPDRAPDRRRRGAELRLPAREEPHPALRQRLGAARADPHLDRRELRTRHLFDPLRGLRPLRVVRAGRYRPLGGGLRRRRLRREVLGRRLVLRVARRVARLRPVGRVEEGGPLVVDPRRRNPRFRRRSRVHPRPRKRPRHAARLAAHTRALLPRARRMARPRRDLPDRRRRAVGVLRVRLLALRGERDVPALAPRRRRRLLRGERQGERRGLPHRRRGASFARRLRRETARSSTSASRRSCIAPTPAPRTSNVASTIRRPRAPSAP